MPEKSIFSEVVGLGDKLKHYFAPRYLNNLTIIDAGANVGAFIEKIRGMNIRNHIIAIEPCKTNISILQNKSFDNVEIVEGALVGLSGSKTASFTEIEGLSEWGSITNINTNRGRAKGKIHNSYVVKTLTLDNIAYEEIGYLKMDVEGCETDIILTMTKDLSMKIKQISLEVHNKDEKLLADKMNDLGYITQWYEKDMELFGIRKEVVES